MTDKDIEDRLPARMWVDKRALYHPAPPSYCKESDGIWYDRAPSDSVAKDSRDAAKNSLTHGHGVQPTPGLSLAERIADEVLECWLDDCEWSKQSVIDRINKVLNEVN